MVIVWTACFSGLFTFVIKPLFSIHCLHDGVTACTMHMPQCGWGSEEGVANQVLRDPAQIHINPRTATLYRHLPLASLVGAVPGRISRQLRAQGTQTHEDAGGHQDPPTGSAFALNPNQDLVLGPS